MTRFVLMPHIHGKGHRVRCDTLGTALLSSNHKARVTLALRRDDPLRESEWTVLPTVRSSMKRTWAIIWANVLIEDGLALTDFRVRLMKRLGGKLVLVVQPEGFSTEPVVRESLAAADLILVPYPAFLFRPQSPLMEFREKVRVVPPVFSLESVVREPPIDRLLVYVSVSRPTDGLSSVLEATREQLAREFGRPVDLEGEVGSHRAPEEHARSLSRCHVVLTQGTTMAFEAAAFGIPIVMLPHPNAPEQVQVAEALEAAGVAVHVLGPRLMSSGLSAAILDALRRPRPEALGTLRSGTADAARLLSELANPRGAEAPSRRPSLSIISTNYNCAHALRKHLESIYAQFREDEFEYVVVDNRSRDASPDILRAWAADHPNFVWLSRRCTRGRGAEIAAGHSWAPFILLVDTDTVYFPILRPFVDRAVSSFSRYAVQAIYAGVFPRFLWRVVGGRENFNFGEDFDMWMRLHRIGRMKWYPVRMGENLKEPWARDSQDYLSARYRTLERVQRLVRREFDKLRHLEYADWDLQRVWKSNAIDLGLAPTESTWFGETRPGGLLERGKAFGRAAFEALKA